MSNRVCCRACRTYIEKDNAVYVGLGYVCDNADCPKKVREKSRKAQKAQKANGNCIPPEVRKAVRLRDKGQCRFCATTRGTQCHHIRYRSEGGPHVEENLILLCAEHHAVVHGSKRYWQPLLLAFLDWHYASKEFILIPQFERRFDSSLVLSCSEV